MASKTSKPAQSRSSASPAAQTPTPTEGAGFSLAQQQLQTLMSLTDLMFKGAEEVRRFQMQAAHDARERHERAHAEVASAGNPNELLSVQSELVRYDVEAGSRYWQQLASIMAATQAEAVNVLTRGAASLGGDVARLTTQPQAAAPQGAAREGGNAEADPTQAWNRWVDFGKQWTDMLYRTEAALH